MTQYAFKKYIVQMFQTNKTIRMSDLYVCLWSDCFLYSWSAQSVMIITVLMADCLDRRALLMSMGVDVEGVHQGLDYMENLYPSPLDPPYDADMLLRNFSRNWCQSGVYQ